MLNSTLVREFNKKQKTYLSILKSSFEQLSQKKGSPESRFKIFIHSQLVCKKNGEHPLLTAHINLLKNEKRSRSLVTTPM